MSSSLQLTRTIAAFVSRIEFDVIPRRCIEAATIGFTDCMGVMIAGADEQAVRIVAAMAESVERPDAACQIPSGRLLSAPDAALVNGVAAHVLDYDDVAMAAHPSAVLVPAILAEGGALDASGENALTAYVAGYELWAQLDALEPGRLHERGFHPTAILGAVAAAAACARLRGLDLEQTAHAIGIAASLASGLVANFGTMTKSLHAGRAAQSGVMAARLAAQGFTASLVILEHQTGFLRAFSASGAVRLDAPSDLGIRWHLAERGIDIKRYPTCYATHRCIDAVLAIILEHGLKPDAVSSVHVRTGATQLLLVNNPAPENALEAKFSMQFALAAALIARHVGLDQLTEEFVRRPDVSAMEAKVHCTTTDEKMSGDELFAPDDRVSVVLTSGESLSNPPVTHAKGSWQRPLTRAEMQEKFLECTAVVMTPEAGGLLFDRLWHLDQVVSLRELQRTIPTPCGASDRGSMPDGMSRRLTASSSGSSPN
jgi:2-methylcitrate dehydratase PrpD